MTDSHRRPRSESRPWRFQRRPRTQLIGGLTAATALALSALTGLPQTAQAATARQVERLDRGLTSVHTGSGNLVSWRWLATDPDNVAFNVYRGGTRLNPSPLTASTNYLDTGAADSAAYTVRAVVNGIEQPPSEHAVQFRAGLQGRAHLLARRPAPLRATRRTPTRPTTPPSATSTATAPWTSS